MGKDLNLSYSEKLNPLAISRYLFFCFLALSSLFMIISLGISLKADIESAKSFFCVLNKYCEGIIASQYKSKRGIEVAKIFPSAEKMSPLLGSKTTFFTRVLG